MKAFTLTIQTDHGPTTMRATPVDEEGILAVHKSHEAGLRQTWVVTHRPTGRSLARGLKKKAHATEVAQVALATRLDDAMSKRNDLCAAATSFSPGDIHHAVDSFLRPEKAWRDENGTATLLLYELSEYTHPSTRAICLQAAHQAYHDAHKFSSPSV